MNIQINDCTIRDGGYLFGKNSSKQFVNGIIKGLLDSGIDIIEVGFLQTVVKDESIVYSNSTGARQYIPKGVSASRFTGFCDNSRYCLDNLDICDGKAFEYLRISFAKHESEEALEFIAGAKAKGYKVFANPMDAPSYSDEERRKMIEKINKISPYAFSIVDTFGTMYIEDLRAIFGQIDAELDKSIRVGLHSHNNLQLSNALAEVMVDLATESDRDVVIDGSLYSMGRGAGNASTELLACYLNTKHGKQYNVSVLLDTIEKYIIPCMNSNEVDRWGYDLPMLVCGLLGSHVDNIAHLYDSGLKRASDMLHIIASLSPEQRKRYGKTYSKSNFSTLDEAYLKYRKV